MSNQFHPEEESNESINRYTYIFSDYKNNPPTLSEALDQMFKSENLPQQKCNELTGKILQQCNSAINRNFAEIKNKYNNISKEDACIICSYTCDLREKREMSPYRLLNKNLIQPNREQGIKNISKYLYIFLKSLRKLPRYYPVPPNKYLYRSIPLKVNMNNDPNNERFVPYKTGNKKTLWGFTSTCSNPQTGYLFLKRDSGTFFSIGGDVWGYDIKLFNYFGEEEILLEPERQYVIDNALPPLNGIINITCSILKTPLVLD